MCTRIYSYRYVYVQRTKSFEGWTKNLLKKEQSLFSFRSNFISKSFFFILKVSEKKITLEKTWVFLNNLPPKFNKSFSLPLHVYFNCFRLWSCHISVFHGNLKSTFREWWRSCIKNTLFENEKKKSLDSLEHKHHIISCKH